MNVKPLLVVLIGVTGLLLLCGSGCQSRTEIETAHVEYSFQNAGPIELGLIQKALSEINTKDYRSALDSLNRLAQSSRLTPAQQESIRDLVLQLQDKLRENGAGQTGSKTTMPGAEPSAEAKDTPTR